MPIVYKCYSPLHSLDYTLEIQEDSERIVVRVVFSHRVGFTLLFTNGSAFCWIDTPVTVLLSGDAVDSVLCTLEKLLESSVVYSTIVSLGESESSVPE